MWRTDLLGKFYNDDERRLSGQILAVGLDDALVLYNWKEFRARADNMSRGVKPADPLMLCDVPYQENTTLEVIETGLSDTPKYLQNNYNLVKKPFAFPASRVTIQSGRKETPARKIKPASHDANQSWSNIMAKCAVFDTENDLINVYDSGKAAKAAHKGATDLKFVTEKDFAPIGEYTTVEQLFPKAEKEVKEVAEGTVARTRVVVKREGAYTVVKKDGARFNEGDERGLLHTALVENTTVEAYLAAAPAEAKFTSARGAEQKVSATGYMAYGAKRGWIKFPDQQVDPEVEVVEETENA